MRAIFLDFDGPMHPISAITGLVPPVLNLAQEIEQRQLMRHLPLLDRALEDHEDVGIVVHSAWRRFVDNAGLRHMLGPLADRMLGITSTGLERYEGILQLVERAGIDDYLIIDDAAEEFPAGLHRLALVCPENGITDPQALDALSAWLSSSAAAPTPQGAEVDYRLRMSAAR